MSTKFMIALLALMLMGTDGCYSEDRMFKPWTTQERERSILERCGTEQSLDYELCVCVTPHIEQKYDYETVTVFINNQLAHFDKISQGEFPTNDPSAREPMRSFITDVEAAAQTCIASDPQKYARFIRETALVGCYLLDHDINIAMASCAVDKLLAHYPIEHLANWSLTDFATNPVLRKFKDECKNDWIDRACPAQAPPAPSKAVPAIDRDATDTAPWRIGEIIDENDSKSTVTRFLGITFEGHYLLQDFNRDDDSIYSEAYRASDIRREGTTVHIVREGRYVAYYRNGNAMYEHHYNQGGFDGRVAFWYETGQIQDVFYYRDDRRVDVSCSWNRDGRLMDIYEHDTATE